MCSDAGILPPALEPRDTIAFISPSSRLNRVFPARIYRGKAFLESLGFKIKIFFNDAPTSSIHESILQRCTEIHSAFLDPEVKAIICTIGGISSNELLRHLDYGLIKANPKIFCGYSDITLLHHALFTQTGLRTFYGPAVIPQFGEFPKPIEFSVSHFMKVLCSLKPVGQLPRCIEWTEETLDWMDGTDASRPRHTVPSTGWEWLRPGRATGRIFGGCLPSFAQIAGTKYSPSFKARILFLENPEGEVFGTPLPYDRTRLFFVDLVNRGLLDDIAGLVIGRPYWYNDEQRAQYRQLVLDICHGTGFPILYNVDIGHSDPQLTIPMNAMTTLDSEKDEFKVSEPGVAEKPSEK